MFTNSLQLTSSGEPSAPTGAMDTAALVDLLRAWDIPDGREEVVHDMALASLEQVKGSTEYEDARALLMIVAFLTALAGAVFNRFSLTYGLPRWQEITQQPDCILPAITYAMFGAYAVIVSVSAFIIFGAMKPTFYNPHQISGHSQPVGFHARLVNTHPWLWGQSFIELAGDGTSGRDNLKAHYAKHYILESYLVAHRIADKLRKAAPAVRWLQLSMLFLAGFIVSYGATLVVFAAPTIAAN